MYLSHSERGYLSYLLSVLVSADCEIYLYRLLHLQLLYQPYFCGELLNSIRVLVVKTWALCQWDLVSWDFNILTFTKSRSSAGFTTLQL